MESKTDKDTLEVVLEYHMTDDSDHSMNIQTHNLTEKYLLEAIKRIEVISGCKLSIRLMPYEEGSFKDKLSVILESSLATGLTLGLFNHFISPAPSKTETEEMINRVELITKIKAGKLNEQDISYVMAGDKSLLKACSGYYSALSKDNDVKKVDCSTSLNNNTPKTTSIERKDFVTHIISNKTITTNHEYKGTTVLITSPVLSKSSKSKWKGVFNGSQIKFDIKDKLFKKQIFNNEVQFEYGTTLNCDVVKTTITKYGNNGEIANEQSSYLIKNITSWDDGKHFQQYTKRYRKMKATESQLDLFSEQNKQPNNND